MRDLFPGPYLDGLRLPLKEAATLAFCGTDAAIVFGGDFALVAGEAKKGGRDLLLLSTERDGEL